MTRMLVIGLLVTAPLALAFTILGGAATNFATVAIARVFAGLFASPCLTVGGGIISDVWNISLEKTGTIFAALFVLLVVAGTQTGPMASAAIITNLSWRLAWTGRADIPSIIPISSGGLFGFSFVLTMVRSLEYPQVIKLTEQPIAMPPSVP
ncbi:hypothetical protein EYC84_003728 [Monilinia fructicola]|uniref:Major facilitator superfamily (MFS) profile domain-containing protein n=1 Tax=Monilinia fructicola TaxID=38448 RepID=A0A5M9JVK4_MONFR|nr:hypothetical protein EYC84_003728 [Monilinia fructicola]